jgi:hypothetical protein
MVTGDRRSTTRDLWMLGHCVALTVVSLSPVSAQPGGQQTAKSCESLASMVLLHTRITMAQHVDSGAFVAPAPPPRGTRPANYSRMQSFCRVAAIITPVPGSEIKIEVWLPEEGWNGKFVGVGNGGLVAPFGTSQWRNLWSFTTPSPQPTRDTTAIRPTRVLRSGIRRS